MKKELTIGLLTVALTVGLASMASAQEDIEDQETDVDVTVDTVTQLDVRPSSLSYEDVAPGSEARSSQNGFEHVDIENIGSTRIREIYAQATMATDQPFGATEDSVVYDTGNFIQLSLETAESQGVSGLADSVEQASGLDEYVPHYVNRVEYFEENPPEYITVDEDAGGDEAEQVIGRFREGDVEYFFQLSQDGAGDGTENEEMELRIGRAPHTSTQLGTVDFEDGDFVAFDENDDFGQSTGAGDEYMILNERIRLVSFDTDDEDYTGDNLLNDDKTISSEVENLDNSRVTEYDLFIHPQDGDTDNEDSAHILRTSYNTEPVSPAELNESGEGSTLDPTEVGSAQQYILDASSAENQLQPGQNFPVNIGVELPQGVDQNAIKNGAVTFFASEGQE